MEQLKNLRSTRGVQRKESKGFVKELIQWVFEATPEVNVQIERTYWFSEAKSINPTATPRSFTDRQAWIQCLNIWACLGLKLILRETYILIPYTYISSTTKCSHWRQWKISQCCRRSGFGFGWIRRSIRWSYWLRMSKLSFVEMSDADWSWLSDFYFTVWSSKYSILGWWHQALVQLMKLFDLVPSPNIFWMSIWFSTDPSNRKSFFCTLI